MANKIEKVYYKTRDIMRKLLPEAMAKALEPGADVRITNERIEDFEFKLVPVKRLKPNKRERNG